MCATTNGDREIWTIGPAPCLGTTGFALKSAIGVYIIHKHTIIGMNIKGKITTAHCYFSGRSSAKYPIVTLFSQFAVFYFTIAICDIIHKAESSTAGIIFSNTRGVLSIYFCRISC